MNWPFAILALLIVSSGIAAVTLRNLVHCALMLMVTLTSVAALYLLLGAQFVGFAQVLIYVGAVAILIVFAILLTRGSEPPRQPIFSGSWAVGVGVAVAVFALLGAVILSSRALPHDALRPPEPTVHRIGEQLMGKYVLPLEVVGLLLTAALIGAVIIAMHEEEAE